MTIYSFSGCGTMYYGKRDQRPDGTYIMTAWITLLFVPLIPVGSYRVLPIGVGTIKLTRVSEQYQSTPVPLCWAQVRNVFAISGPIILLIYFLAR